MNILSLFASYIQGRKNALRGYTCNRLGGGVMMKIRLAKKIMKADPYDDYPSKRPSPYWKAKFNEAYNGYGCFMFCDNGSKCKHRNKFDNRIKKAMSLTI